MEQPDLVSHKHIRAHGNGVRTGTELSCWSTVTVSARIGRLQTASRNSSPECPVRSFVPSTHILSHRLENESFCRLEADVLLTCVRMCRFKGHVSHGAADQGAGQAPEGLQAHHAHFSERRRGCQSVPIQADRQAKR